MIGQWQNTTVQRYKNDTKKSYPVTQTGHYLSCRSGIGD